MFDAARRTALHFSMPLDDLDWQNLRTSGVRLVQLPWSQALFRPAPQRPTQLESLTAAGYDVILRMGIADALALGLHSAGALDRLRAALQERLAHTNSLGLAGVIIFNEPDMGPDGRPYNLAAGSPSWHQAEARLHCSDTAAVAAALSGLVPLCAAPLTNRFATEGATPEPGLMEWWTELRPAYHSSQFPFAGVGAHIYEEFLNDDPGSINTARAKFKLKLWGTFWQPPLWIDEFNVTHGTPVERGRAWASMIRYLQVVPERVALFSPFVSNGLGNAYGPGLVVRDPAAYQELRRVVAP